MIANLNSFDIKGNSDFLNKDFFENLLKNDNLSSLSISRSNLSKESDKVFIEYFEKTNTLNNFTYLCKNDQTNKQVFKALKANTSIQSLDISGNRPKHTIEILKSIQNHKSLKALDISKSWFDHSWQFASDGTDNGNEVGELLAHIIENNNLEQIDASRCDIGNSGGKAIAQALYNNPSTKYLNLEANCMTKPAIDVFNENLPANIVLDFLNLTENRSDFNMSSTIRAIYVHNSESDAIEPKEALEVEGSGVLGWLDYNYMNDYSVALIEVN